MTDQTDSKGFLGGIAKSIGLRIALILFVLISGQLGIMFYVIGAFQNSLDTLSGQIDGRFADQTGRFDRIEQLSVESIERLTRVESAVEGTRDETSDGLTAVARLIQQQATAIALDENRPARSLQMVYSAESGVSVAALVEMQANETLLLSVNVTVPADIVVYRPIQWEEFDEEIILEEVPGGFFAATLGPATTLLIQPTRDILSELPFVEEVAATTEPLPTGSSFLTVTTPIAGQYIFVLQGAEQ